MIISTQTLSERLLETFSGLPKTNNLAYYKNPYITAIKSFIVEAPG